MSQQQKARAGGATPQPSKAATTAVAGTYRVVVEQQPPQQARRDAACEAHMGSLGHSRYKHMHPMPSSASFEEDAGSTAQSGMYSSGSGGDGVDVEAVPRSAEMPSAAGAGVDVAVQTLYRESEAQTEPFTPEYAVAEGERPEVLRLAELGFGFGSGLPAGVDEVEGIEWLRRRDALARTLEGEADTAKRKVIEAQLREMDTARHEQYIDASNAARVQALREAMAGLDQQVRERADRRVAAIVDRGDASRERVLEQARRRRLRSLRKLEEERMAVSSATSTKSKRTDIVSELGNPASRTLAPLDREGSRPTGPATFAEPELSFARTVALSRPSRTAAAADATVAQGDATSLVPQQRAAIGRRVGGGTQSASREEARRKASEEETVRMAEHVRRTAHAQDSSLATSATGSARVAMPLRLSSARPSLGQLGLSCAQKVVRPAARPPTPTIQGATTSADDRASAAAVLLQRLLRGRAVQNEMFAGLLRRRELIEELVSPPPSTAVTFTPAPNVFDAVALKAGVAIGRALDFYAKQLTRQRDHSRLLAMAEAAARQREDREAAERHRRDAEMEQLRKTEAAYAEIMASCAATADFVLRGVFEESVEATAARQALAFAKAYNPPAEAPEGEIGRAVRGLLETFLWPTVEKTHNAIKKEQDEQKFALAARLALQSV